MHQMATEGDPLVIASCGGREDDPAQRHYQASAATTGGETSASQSDDGGGGASSAWPKRARIDEAAAAAAAGLSAQFVDFYHSTSAQKLCLAFLGLYLLVGVVAFSLLFEQYSIIDSLYFAVVTFTTVGYGDFKGIGAAERIFMIVYILAGITCLGVGLGILGERIVEARQRGFRDAREQSEATVLGMVQRDPFSEPNGRDSGSGNQTIQTRSLHVVIQQQQQQQRPQQQGAGSGGSVCKDMREILTAVGPLAVIIVLVSVFMGYVEGWTILESIYFCVVSTTTVGYGDVTPRTERMRLLTVFFLPIAVAVTATFIGRVAGAYMDMRTRRAEEQFLKRRLTPLDLKVMDTDRVDGVCYAEFLSFMLVALQKVEQADIDRLEGLFHSLDVDSNGRLDHKDVDRLKTLFPVA